MKKGQISIFRIIIYAVIVLAVIAALTAVFLAPGGLLQRAATQNFSDLIPTIGADREIGERPAIAVKHQEELQSLKATIEKMLASNKKNCFANYGGFSDLGEKGTSINIVHKPEKGTVFSVYGGVDGLQYISESSFEIEGMEPCVIAGDRVIVSGFFFKFIKPEVEGVSPYYNPVSGIKISYVTEGCTDGNKITVPSFGNKAPNDECDNLKDGGWLFTPDNGNICFFPTGGTPPFGNYGLNSKYFTSEIKQTIPNRIAEGTLEEC